MNNFISYRLQKEEEKKELQKIEVDFWCVCHDMGICFAYYIQNDQTINSKTFHFIYIFAAYILHYVM